MGYEFPYDDWADIYDAVNDERTHDIGFYVRQAQRAGGPVLELGCGTGRIGLAIAAKGVDVVGVDISPRIVEVANRKARERGLEGRAIFQPGDMADVHVEGAYGLVIFPFRSFQSMLDPDEQAAALSTAAAHLAPGGTLIVDLFVPDPAQLSEPPGTLLHIADVKQPDGGTVVVWGQNGWDPVSQVNEVRLVIEMLDPEGTVLRRLYRDFDQRYTFRYEMEHLLARCGFAVEEVYGDFAGGPVTPDTEDLVFVARRG
jgi:SAM-dependent methyltransferase